MFLTLSTISVKNRKNIEKWKMIRKIIKVENNQSLVIKWKYLEKICH